ncbi:MAG TPA: TMEM165/GDT1 family protein [Steroidobacteraceae bacterium]|jgi:putative Ca2+/H+ antiporter (TMEM165/GDT1 family)|nr:TMEM165/GDT1 family protein [Steroidobacteraceae bacterium]
MESFLVSTGVVALAEIGDKTQLLALLLAARFRRPLPIVLGILAATLANHALAGAAGAWCAALVGPEALRWILGLSFIAMAAWTLVPDKAGGASAAEPRFGVFGATAIAFFLVEMGDKTQIATVALAARYASLAAVVGGTTLGMMLANVPVVLLGEVAATKLPMRLVRAAAALVFAALGAYVLM